MALLGPFAFQGQVYPDIGQMGRFAKVIMPDHAVEIHGRGSAHVSGEVFDFIYPAQVILKIAHHPVRCFQGGALGHVNDHLEFVFVVKGQHFKRYQPEKHQAGGKSQQNENGGKQQVAAGSGFQKRGDQFPVGVKDPLGRAFLFLPAIGGRVAARDRAFFQQGIAHPGNDCQGAKG